jgi:hypothetical protein
MPVTEIARLDRDRSQWDDAFYAFLAVKERRSGPGPAENRPGPVDDIHWTRSHVVFTGDRRAGVTRGTCAPSRHLHSIRGVVSFVARTPTSPR